MSDVPVGSVPGECPEAKGKVSLLICIKTSPRIPPSDSILHPFPPLNLHIYPRVARQTGRGVKGEVQGQGWGRQLTVSVGARVSKPCRYVNVELARGW